MRHILLGLAVAISLACSLPLAAQQSSATSSATTQGSTVPRVIQFSGVVKDANGRPQTGAASLTFVLYESQDGGTALWSETQTAELDAQGNYTVQLGANSTGGLPLSLFTTVAARWLGVQPQLPGFPEQPRVLLVGVPYAIKAADADTLGGLPASAFLQQLTGNSPRASIGGTNLTPSGAAGAGSSNFNPLGTANYIPVWTGPKTQGNSIMYQTIGQNIGISTTTPAATLEVNGTGKFDGLITFASGQTFPGTGTITGVTAGTGLTGGGTSGSVTLNVDTAKVPQLNSANTFTRKQTVNAQGIYTASSNSEVLQVSQSGGTGHGIVANTRGTNANGVQGNVTATSGTAGGVRGFSASPTGRGVVGVSSNLGVVGFSSGTSKEGSGFGSAGVWGDTGAPANVAFTGVLGTADDNPAGEFFNNTGNDINPTLFAKNDSSNETVLVFRAEGGQVGGSCVIDVSGNLTCTGTFDNAVDVEGGVRKVALYSMQSPENWFEDAGSGTLSGGSATIALDPTFAQTVNAGMEYHVFLTPNGDCKGLFVTNKTPGSFEVREQGGGTSNIAFDYRIMAKRKGFENQRLADVTGRMGKRPPQHMRGTAGSTTPASGGQ